MGEIQQVIQEMVQAGLQQISAALGQTGQVVNNIGLRLETLYFAVQDNEILTEDELRDAHTRFMDMRMTQQKIMQLPPAERFEKYLAYNAQDGVCKIRPMDLQFHAWLMHRGIDMSLEERLEKADLLGFGEPFKDGLRKTFERPSPQDTPSEIVEDLAAGSRAAKEPSLIITP